MKEYSGELYTASLFNRMKKNFVRIHNQFMYIYSNVYAQARRRRDARRIDDGSNRRSGYYGFRMQFPATYNREFFTTSQQECQDWVNVIRDMTEVRKIEDYYDIREKIGEGRFATVYRVGMERGVE